MVLPLLVAEQMVGVISAYAHARDAFDDQSVRRGVQFAGPAAVSVYNAQKLHRLQDATRRLQHSLRDRAVIDQAIGLLRGRTGASADEALAHLMRISATDDLELRAAAHRLVEKSVDRTRMLRP